LSRLPTLRSATILHAASLAFLALGFARSMLVWQTGILVSDEYGYLLAGWTGQLSNAIIGDRQAFAAINAGLFAALRVNGIDRALAVLPIYITTWGLITVFSVWSTLKLLRFGPTVRTFAVLFLITTPAFLFLSLGFFTESVALALASLGVYFMVRMLKMGSIVSGLVSAGLFLAAMHSREPFSILFLSLWAVAAAGAVVIRPYRRRLVILAVVLLLISGATYYPFRDPVTKQVVDYGLGAVNLGALGRTLPFAPQYSNQSVTYTKTYTSTVSGTAETITVTKTATAGNSNGGSGGANGGGSSGNSSGRYGSTGGILGALGVEQVPASSLLRAVLLMFLACVTGYGTMLVLFVIGVPLLGYLVVTRRDARRASLMLLLATLLLLTVAGTVALFIGQPAYFGVQHYSTLLRFADTGSLAVPVIAAPVLATVARSRKGRGVLLVAVFVPYAAAAPILASFAVTNLPQSENPISLVPQPGPIGTAIQLRNYVFAHPSVLPLLVVGYRYSSYYTPGLAGNPGLSFTDYITGSELVNASADRVVLYSSLQSLGSLRETYPVDWNFLNGALNGTDVQLYGFHVESVIFQGPSDVLVLLSRV
jgi:hypothetical protein